MRGTRRLILILAGALAAAGGCTDIGGLSVASDDQLAQPGQTVRVVTQMRRRGLSRWFPPSNMPPIRIYRDNELLAEHRPGGEAWEFVTEVTLDTVGEHAIDAIYQSRADRKPLQATCYAYCWDASRVGIAVDLDRVVCRKTQLDRMLGDRPLGDPREDCAATLAALAQDYYLCYLTEHGPDMKEDIRAWLKENGLPVGPIFTWDTGRRMSLRSGDQAAVLAELRERVPALLIGVGEGKADLEAFTANRMLAVMVQFDGTPAVDPQAPRVAGWRGLWALFNLPANRPILTDPRQMLELHHRGGEYVSLGHVEERE